MSYRKIILAVTASLFSLTAFASGSYSGGSSSGGSGSGYSVPRPKPVDQAYEYGKSIYFGRIEGKTVSYCINKENVSSPVKRSSIKIAKGVTYTQLGELLHNCENPTQNMSTLLNKNQLNAVAYYLNKRYRLKLVRS